MKKLVISIALIVLSFSLLGCSRTQAPTFFVSGTNTTHNSATVHLNINDPDNTASHINVSIFRGNWIHVRNDLGIPLSNTIVLNDLPSNTNLILQIVIIHHATGQDWNPFVNQNVRTTSQPPSFTGNTCMSIYCTAFLHQGELDFLAVFPIIDSDNVVFRSTFRVYNSGVFLGQVSINSASEEHFFTLRVPSNIAIGDMRMVKTMYYRLQDGVTRSVTQSCC